MTTSVFKNRYDRRVVTIG